MTYMLDCLYVYSMVAMSIMHQQSQSLVVLSIANVCVCVPVFNFGYQSVASLKEVISHTASNGFFLVYILCMINIYIFIIYIIIVEHYFVHRICSRNVQFAGLLMAALYRQIVMMLVGSGGMTSLNHLTL